MKIRKVYNLILQGSRPIIQFSEDITNFVEESVEPNMRCKIIKATKEYENSICFELDLKGFEKYNKLVAKPDWYDKNNEPRLTWFETSSYPKDGITTIYVPIEVDAPFILIQDKNIELFNQYLNSESKLTYLEWLEQIIIKTKENYSPYLNI